MVEIILLAINVIVLVFLTYSIDFSQKEKIMVRIGILTIAAFGIVWLMTGIESLFFSILIIGALNILSTVITEDELPPLGVLFIKVVPFLIGVYSIIYYFTA